MIPSLPLDGVCTGGGWGLGPNSVMNESTVKDENSFTDGIPHSKKTFVGLNDNAQLKHGDKRVLRSIGATEEPVTPVSEICSCPISAGSDVTTLLCSSLNCFWATGRNGKLQCFSVNQTEEIMKLPHHAAPKVDHNALPRLKDVVLVACIVCYKEHATGTSLYTEDTGKERSSEIWCGMRSGSVTVWGAQNCALIESCNAHRFAVSAITSANYSFRGQGHVKGRSLHVWTGGRDRTLRLWDTKFRKCFRKIETRFEPELLHYVSTEQQVWSAGHDGSLMAWGAEGQLCRVISAPGYAPRTVAMYFEAKTRRFWSSTQETTYCWDATHGELLDRWPGYGSEKICGNSQGVFLILSPSITSRSKERSILSSGQMCPNGSCVIFVTNSPEIFDATVVATVKPYRDVLSVGDCALHLVGLSQASAHLTRFQIMSLPGEAVDSHSFLKDHIYHEKPQQEQCASSLKEHEDSKTTNSTDHSPNPAPVNEKHSKEATALSGLDSMSSHASVKQDSTTFACVVQPSLKVAEQRHSASSSLRALIPPPPSFESIQLIPLPDSSVIEAQNSSKFSKLLFASENEIVEMNSTTNSEVTDSFLHGENVQTFLLMHKLDLNSAKETEDKSHSPVKIESTTVETRSCDETSVSRSVIDVDESFTASVNHEGALSTVKPVSDISLMQDGCVECLSRIEDKLDLFLSTHSTAKIIPMSRQSSSNTELITKHKDSTLLQNTNSTTDKVALLDMLILHEYSQILRDLLDSRSKQSEIQNFVEDNHCDHDNFQCLPLPPDSFSTSEAALTAQTLYELVKASFCKKSFETSSMQLQVCTNSQDVSIQTDTKEDLLTIYDRNQNVEQLPKAAITVGTQWGDNHFEESKKDKTSTFNIQCFETLTSAYTNTNISKSTLGNQSTDNPLDPELLSLIRPLHEWFHCYKNQANSNHERSTNLTHKFRNEDFDPLAQTMCSALSLELSDSEDDTDPVGTERTENLVDDRSMVGTDFNNEIHSPIPELTTESGDDGLSFTRIGSIEEFSTSAVASPPQVVLDNLKEFLVCHVESVLRQLPQVVSLDELTKTPFNNPKDERIGRLLFLLPVLLWLRLAQFALERFAQFLGGATKDSGIYSESSAVQCLNENDILHNNITSEYTENNIDRDEATEFLLKLVGDLDFTVETTESKVEFLLKEHHTLPLHELTKQTISEPFGDGSFEEFSTMTGAEVNELSNSRFSILSSSDFGEMYHLLLPIDRWCSILRQMYAAEEEYENHIPKARLEQCLQLVNLIRTIPIDEFDTLNSLFVYVISTLGKVLVFDYPEILTNSQSQVEEWPFLEHFDATEHSSLHENTKLFSLIDGFVMLRAKLTSLKINSFPEEQGTLVY